MTPKPEKNLIDQLQKQIEGEVLSNPYDLGRYATDASVYQMTPGAVVLPKTMDDVRACLGVAASSGVPLLARGGGTSQCGQTVNHALVIDCSRHLNKLIELDVANRRCVVEPGIVLDELNRALAPHGLWYPVDVSTASRATIGGMAANNSCGQRSIYYGTMKDNVLSIDALMADGSEFLFSEASPDTDKQKQLYHDLTGIGERHRHVIKERFPSVLRRVGGYNIDALLPEAKANMSNILVGSEGTLALSKTIELKLWPLPVNKVLGVCHFPTFYQAMDAAQHLVKLSPTAVELVDSTMINLARDIELFRPAVEQFIRGNPAAVLIVEFAFDDQAENIRHLKLLDECMASLGFSWNNKDEQAGGVVEAVEPALQKAIGEVRKAGLNIMMSMKTRGKPVSFVEDCAVELKDLAEYTAGLTEIFHKYDTEGTWYAHASVGCLHVRPVLNLKLDKDANAMRAIAEEAFDLVLKYKGSHSGEHGDGISRSEFHEKMFGEEIVDAFMQVKNRFDPNGVLNPGKIVNAPRMNERSLLRYHQDYQPQKVESRLSWQDWGDRHSGFQGAVEMCNNNGACRKLKGGAMCPSYRVTRNEKDVTRGRANTLRLALSGQLGDHALASDEMLNTMKLCVSCKACKRECPTGVDMAKMKIEVLAARHTGGNGGKQWSLHERLVSQLPAYAPFASRFASISNLRNNNKWLAKAMEGMTGFSASRKLPEFQRKRFTAVGPYGQGHPVVLFTDTFNTWFESENLQAAIEVLVAFGYQVHIAGAAQNKRLCCGRTHLSVGNVEKARELAGDVCDSLYSYVSKGIPVIGLEPSCLLTLRDEHLSLLENNQVKVVADNAFLFEEFIARELDQGALKLPVLKSPGATIKVHGHCHQKSFDLMGTVSQTLNLLPDANVEVIDSGCCGMAGSFGYQTDTELVSRQMAALDLIPAIEASDPETIIVADGTSCRHQIADCAGRTAQHVVQVLRNSLPRQANS